VVGNLLSSRFDTDWPAATASAMQIALSLIVGFSRLCWLRSGWALVCTNFLLQWLGSAKACAADARIPPLSLARVLLCERRDLFTTVIALVQSDVRKRGLGRCLVRCNAMTWAASSQVKAFMPGSGVSLVIWMAAGAGDVCSE